MSPIMPYLLQRFSEYLYRATYHRDSIVLPLVSSCLIGSVNIYKIFLNYVADKVENQLPRRLTDVVAAATGSWEGQELCVWKPIRLLSLTVATHALESLSLGSFFGCGWNWDSDGHSDWDWGSFNKTSIAICCLSLSQCRRTTVSPEGGKHSN